MLFAAAAVFAGGTAYRQSRRPPLVMTVLNQPAQSVVQAAAQEELPRVLIYHTHTWEDMKSRKANAIRRRKLGGLRMTITIWLLWEKLLPKN